MQKLAALLLGRGYSDSQMLTEFHRPDKKPHSSEVPTRLPTRRRSLRPGHTAVVHKSFSSRFNGFFLQAAQAA